jgi:pyrroloquinoline quinone biosynthesis protein D
VSRREARARIGDDAFVPKLARRARLKLDRHENKHMIVYPERGLLLNDAAASIATRCDGARTVTAIVDELCALHPDAPRGDIARDVRAFLADLLDKGLLDLR